LTRSNLLGLIQYTLAGREALALEASRIRFGSHGDILVSQTPRPEEMSAVVARQGQAAGRMTLAQDTAFFRWRFGNPRGKYVFYYWLKEGMTIGYVVLSLSPNNQRGYIVDYAQAGDGAIQEIVGYIINSKRFRLLSIYRFCLDDTIGQVLERFGFKANNLVRTLERKRYGELPLLIRLVRENYTEADWLVEGLDVRRIENWSLKPIFSDAV
jgi:hypothetical protein